MLRRLLPRKNIFFVFMDRQAAKAVEAIAALRVMLGDLGNVKAHLDTVKTIERVADDIAHEAIAQLHRTFITPMDRHDINRMTQRLDDVVDLIESVAQRLYHYDLEAPPQAVMRMVDVLDKQIAVMQRVVGRLSDLRHNEDIKAALVEIHSYENEADEILRPAIGDLFRHEADPKLIIKWKEIYEHLEQATDRCEDVADLVENILLEYA